MFQRIGAWIITVVCGALLAACAAAPPVAQVSAAATAARPPQAATNNIVAPVPVIATTTQDAPIAAQWNELLEHGDFKQVMETYALVPKLETANGDVKADACKAHADALEGALKINPVSMALWYDAYQCAKALGQADLAEQRLQSFTKVVGFALRSSPPDWGDTPIRVLHFDDVAAFIRASGDEVLNLYVDRVAGSRYLPVTVLLSDSAHHRKMLTFDFLDSGMRITRTPDAQFPVVRSQQAGALLDVLVKSSGGRGPFAQAQAMDQALAKGDLQSRIKALQSQAIMGSYVAALRLAAICLYGKTGNCGTQAVDALLPWAAKHDPEAMLWLAIAYADGNGVKASSANAQRLIEAGDRELGDIRVAFVFASLREGRGPEVDPIVRGIIHSQAQAGEPHAEFVIAETADRDSHEHPLSPSVRAGLEHAAKAGLPEAQRLLADVLFRENKHDQGMEWLLKAADADDEQAQRDLADRYVDRYNANLVIGEPVSEKDLELARQWYTRAAQGGVASSMDWLGNYYWGRSTVKGNLLRAQTWFQNAASAGSITGTVQLADLYATNVPGLDGDASKAAEIYRAVIKSHPGNPRALLGLAYLLASGKGVARNPVEARKLRIEAAAGGDAQAEEVLGADLLHGLTGRKDVKAAVSWLEKAIAQGSSAAEVQYADALFEGDKIKRDVPAALRLWKASIAHGNWTGANDAAWYMCTASAPELFDPTHGMHFADLLERVNGIGAAELDTIAACHAAAHDFDGAIGFEKKAIEQAEKMQPRPAKMIDALHEREQLYGQHKRYTDSSS